MSTQIDNRSSYGFVRRAVMRKPDLTIEELHERWKAARMGGDLPTQQDIHYARWSLRKKYGLKSAHDIPFKVDGTLNVSELLRLLLKKDPELTEAKATRALEHDGLHFSGSLFVQVTKKLSEAKVKSKTKPQEEVVESVDPNQHKGPRARVRRKGRTLAKQDNLGLTPKVREQCNAYLDIGNSFDDLIEQAQAVQDSPLVEKIRAARNHCFISVYNLV